MSPRLAQIKRIVEASSRAVWGAFGAEARRTGEVPGHDAIQDMVAQPAADAVIVQTRIIKSQKIEKRSYFAMIFVVLGKERRRH